MKCPKALQNVDLGGMIPLGVLASMFLMLSL